MHRTVRLLLAQILVLLVLLPVPASAQLQEGATLTVLRGQVAVVRPDGSADQPAPSGTVVRAGDEIRTLTRTGALITFFAGTEIEMGEDTILAVEQVSMNGGKVDISLKQVLGTTLNRVQSLTDPTSTYRIDAGGATAVVRGTTFLLIGPVATSSGNVAALICLDDCDGRTTFSGCPVAPFTAFGVSVEKGRVTSGCETASVSRGSDYFNAGFEAVTTFEQTFASANGDVNPGTGNLGVGRRANERREREGDEDDEETKPSPVTQPHLPVALSACQPPGIVVPPATPTLFPGFASTFEGNTSTTTLNLPVFLLPAATSTVTVSFATAGGSATAGTDYVATTGTLTFSPGTSVQNIPITINGDVTPEASETILVNFTNAVGAPLGSSTGFAIILDDDSPIQVSVLPASVVEGDVGTTNLVHTVTLSRTSPTPITVDYQSIGGGTATAGVDFQAAPLTTLTIPANTSSATFTIVVNGDTAVEPDETALVQISNPSAGAVIAGATAAGTIVDDDGPPTISISGHSVAEGCEGTTPLTFSVQLSRALASTVTVNYATANGTATAGSDYTAASGTVTFTPGQTSQQIVVQVIGDTVTEPNETFTVNLSGAAGATIAVPTATGTILNDD